MGVRVQQWFSHAVDKCSLARLEHFTKFQQRKGKFFKDRKRQLRHVVGKKTKKEKEGKEEQEPSGFVPGSDGPDDDKKSDKNKDESPRKTKDKGKGKARYEDKEGEIQDQALGTDQQTSGA